MTRLTAENIDENHFENKVDNIPDFVIEEFDKLILKDWNRSTASAKVYQNDVAKVISERMAKDTGDSVEDCRRDMFARKLLDVEEYYESVGFTVEFIKTPYFSSDSNWFTFSKEK